MFANHNDNFYLSVTIRVVLQVMCLFALFVLLAAIYYAPAYANGEELLIPKWVSKVHQFLEEGLISEKEFSNAMVYLQEKQIIRLVEIRYNDTIGDFLITRALLEQNKTELPDLLDCSSEWYVTGYFTPHESDYRGDLVTTSVEGTSYQLREDFVEVVKIEGWGRTLSGKYLGWYDESFHLSEFPLDALGSRLFIPVVAVDASLIPPNSLLKIPTLPPPWNGVVFLATDVGTSIIGKHVDVYTGEGKNAEEETYRITGYKNTVCLEAK